MFRVHSIICIERFVLEEKNREALYPLFRFILQIVYDCDIISEEGIMQWIELREGENEEGLGRDYGDREDLEHDLMAVQLFQEPAVQAFVDWIKEDSEDEESSDEDEHDGDDDE